jgi:cytochrome c biogenesis protein CcdA
MLAVGAIYIAAVFLTYLAAGFGLLIFIQKLNLSQQLSWGIGVLVILLGLIEIKDFWWYSKGISLKIPAKRAKQVMHYIKNVTIPGSIFLGIFVAAVELPCTGGPYLAITTVLAKLGFSWDVFWLLVVYNFIFVLPLLVILGLVYFGLSVKRVQEWKETQKRWMRLFIGIIMIALGILLLLWAAGVINLGIAG